jgi:hypothetical protein
LGFRTITSKKLKSISGELRFAVRKARHLQAVQKEIFAITPPPFHIEDFLFSYGAPTEETTLALRAFFALETAEQFQWKNHSEAFKALRARLEESGIRVLLLDFRWKRRGALPCTAKFLSSSSASMTPMWPGYLP